MITLWLGLALASPPAGVDLDDLDHWEDGYKELLHGPTGCWAFQGKVQATVVIQQAPDLFSTGGQRRIPLVGTFSGVLLDGVWRKFEHNTRDMQKNEAIELPIIPLFGRIDPDIVVNTALPPKDKASEPLPEDTDDTTTSQGSIAIGSGGAEMTLPPGMEPVSLLRKAVFDWGKVSTTAVDWQEETRSVRLFVDVPLFDTPKSDSLSVTALFPEGGAVPTSIDAIWPKTIKLGDWPTRATLKHPQAHLRAVELEGVLLPSSESFSLVAGMFGFTAGYEQSITYVQAQPCAVSTPAPSADKAIPADPGVNSTQ